MAQHTAPDASENTPLTAAVTPARQASTHLPTLDGWKAELTVNHKSPLVTYYVLCSLPITQVGGTPIHLRFEQYIYCMERFFNTSPS